MVQRRRVLGVAAAAAAAAILPKCTGRTDQVRETDKNNNKPEPETGQSASR